MDNVLIIADGGVIVGSVRVITDLNRLINLSVIKLDTQELFVTINWMVEEECAT